MNLYLEKLFADKVPSKKVLKKTKALAFPLFSYTEIHGVIKEKISDYISHEHLDLATFAVMITHLKIIGTPQLPPEDAEIAQQYQQKSFELEKTFGF